MADVDQFALEHLADVGSGPYDTGDLLTAFKAGYTAKSDGRVERAEPSKRFVPDDFADLCTYSGKV